MTLQTESEVSLAIVTEDGGSDDLCAAPYRIPISISTAILLVIITIAPEGLTLQSHSPAKVQGQE